MTMWGSCGCGALKEDRAATCRECLVAARGASARMKRMRVPQRCGCRFDHRASPWHCRCGRWKQSTERSCEVCIAGVEQIAA